MTMVMIAYFGGENYSAGNGQLRWSLDDNADGSLSFGHLCRSSVAVNSTQFSIWILEVVFLTFLNPSTPDFPRVVPSVQKPMSDPSNAEV